MNEKLAASENHLAKVLEILNHLDRARIHHRMAHNQEDAISIEIAVPGQRWEIDCYANGTVDVEVFKSDGAIRDEKALDELFHNFAD